jgi:uncharacterized ferredoxin-like protein
MMSALNLVAELMSIAAITAPKTKGEDFVTTTILQGEDLDRLAQEMVAYGEQIGKEEGWRRDAGNVAKSACVVLVGIKDAAVAGLNCSACGFGSCLRINQTDGEFRGPQCALRILDLGIALGSAVKTASLFNVDNRIMYRIGVAARGAGLCQDDLVMGIPLSTTGKNIYFDRPAI